MCYIKDMEKLIFTLSALFFAAGGVYFALTGEKNIRQRENFCRWRWPGIVFGIPALLWCVPHAQAVSPAFLVPFFIPLAIIVPIAAFFVLDNITSRTVGGMIIIISYELIHRSFEYSLPLAPAGAVCGWITGFAGIWISGIPRSLRDAFRFAAANAAARWCIAGTAFLAAILAGFFAVMV